MSGFLVRRLLSTIPVMFIVLMVVFVMVRLTTGDPAAIIGGDMATSADLAAIRTKLGLDEPVAYQFLIYASGVLSGDLGYSYFLNRPVVDLIAQRLEPTLSLAFGTLVLSVLIAIPVGTIAAWRMGGWLDRLVVGFSIAGFSVPVFVVGYILIYVFALKLGWLPVQGYSRIADGIGPWMQRLILPWFTLAIAYVALLSRITRASVSEMLTEDYIKTARAKGVGELAIILRHALRNAAVPIVTIIGISAALLIGGVVVTETIFAVPGLGQLTVDAVFNRDFPVLQGIVLFFSFIYVLINLLVDISYLLLDPRIRD